MDTQDRGTAACRLEEVREEQVARMHLRDLIDLKILPKPLALLFRPTLRFFNVGYLPPEVRDALGFMQELHRIAKPDAVATIRVPYGSSDDADEDPTHVRRLFLYSFSYFSQRGYWYADYGYRGDWEVDNIVLTVDEARHGGESFDQLFEELRSQRNVVLEMIATLKAVKPARPRGLRDKSQNMRVEFKPVKTARPF